MENQEKPHILLVDGMALLFRSFLQHLRWGIISPMRQVFRRMESKGLPAIR